LVRPRASKSIWAALSGQRPGESIGRQTSARGGYVARKVAMTGAEEDPLRSRRPGPALGELAY
jgi:hypothetical protein